MAGSVAIPCTIGRSGARREKREGDGATPFGRFVIREWRAPPGPCRLPLRDAATITPASGWCDDPRSGAYNRPVRLPFPASCERMARTDGKYDAVGVLDYNLRPRKRGRGSAIFLHINEENRGTEGCVAIPRDAMRRLLPRLARRVTLEVR